MAEGSRRPRRNGDELRGPRRRGTGRRIAGGSVTSGRGLGSRLVHDEDIAGRSRRISWARRAGVVVALTLLGASLVMGAGTFGGRPGSSNGPGASPRTGASSGASPSAGHSSPGGSPAPTPPHGPAGPTLTALANPFIRGSTVDVSGTLPDGLVRHGVMRLRIYVDKKLARQVKLPKGAAFVVKGIALKLGRHQITASVRSPTGETRRSDPITVTVDRTPPTLSLSRPAEGEVVNADSATIEGRIDGGDQVSIRNETTGGVAAATATEANTFAASLPLGEGVNTFLVTATDAAGNVAEAHLRVVRGEARPSAELTISSTIISISRLPATVTVATIVRDELRAPIAGAQVTFTLSPPGLPTSTYRAETDALGSARWERVNLPRQGALVGKGFATVFVELPGGGTLQETTPFTFE
jgi:hypothetical protein